MNENNNSRDAAIKQIAEAVMQSAAMAATVLSMMGEETSPVDITHQVITCILSNIMHANERKSVKFTIEFVNEEDVRTEVNYDFLEDETSDNRLDPFKRFFDEKDL